MTAYAIGLFTDVDLHEDVATYMERVQGTLDPYEGRFLVHNAQSELMDGDWPGSVVLIEFPSLERAHGWYGSDAYQKLIPMRTDHVSGSVLIVPGIPQDYDPAITAAAIRTALRAG